MMLRHLLDADVRHLRVALTIWLMLVISATIVDGVRPALGAGEGMGAAVSLLDLLVWLASFVFMIALVPLVMQTHPAVGTDAFWMTRPIPPGTLLTAKFVLLGVTMIAMPVVSEAILMVAYKVPVLQIVRVSAEATLYTTFWVALLAVAAAITPSLARFVVLCGATLVALAAVVAAVIAVEVSRVDESPGISEVSTGSDGSDWIVTLALCIVAALALVFVQYRKRSRLRSVPVGIAGVLAAGLLGSHWPWQLLAPRVDVPAWAQGNAGLRLYASAGTVEVQDHIRSVSRSAGAWKVVRANVWLTGLERGWSALGGLTRARIEFGETAALTSRLAAYAVSLPIGSDGEISDHIVQSELLGAELLGDRASLPRELTTVLFVRDTDYRRLASRNGRYEGRFQIQLVRHVIETIMPIEPGAFHQNSAFRLTLEGAALTSGMVSVSMRESGARSVFDRTPASEFSFYLRNRSTHEALRGYAHEPPDGLLSRGLVPFFGGVAFHTSGQANGFTARKLQIEFQRAAMGQRLPIARDWFDEAELVVMRATQEGSIERTLRIARFHLGESAESVPLSE